MFATKGETLQQNLISIFEKRHDQDYTMDPLW